VMSNVAVPIDDFAVAHITVNTTDFDVLYRSQYDAMVRLAYVLFDTQEEAEEVVQDAFAALLARYRRVDQPLAYLRRSVMNGARHRLRRRRGARAAVQPRPEEATRA